MSSREEESEKKSREAEEKHSKERSETRSANKVKLNTSGSTKKVFKFKRKSAAAAAAEPMPKTSPVRSSPTLDWYKIPEIAPKDFVKCCKDIYTVIENLHSSKSTEDPFLKAVVMGNKSISETEWQKAEKVRLTQKVLEMKMGDFHEELMGKFPGYTTLPTGHSTGCDVLKDDRTEVYEVKNRHNTVKGSDGKHIVEMLKKHKAAGMKAVFVQINAPGGKVNRYGAPADIDVWNGKQVYEHLSGRESFFDDLLLTIQYTFQYYKTFNSLKTSLESA